MSAWFPPEASYQAAAMDRAFTWIWFGAALAVVLVVGLAVTYVIQFQRRDESEEGAATGPVDRRLRIAWVAGAMVLAISAFAADFAGFFDQAVPPYLAAQIEVTARRGGWEFQYPGGHVADTLHVAVDQNIQLNLHSADIPHSITVPALRIHEGILPGRTTRTWFVADRADTFELRGNDRDIPGTALISHTPAGYDQWLASVTDIFLTMTPVEAGEYLYGRLGCMTCHSTDGTRITGPSLRDVYGNTFESVTGAMVLVDDAHVRESLLEPNASVRAGYEPVMTPFAGRVDDQEIEAIIAWLKTISSFAAAEVEGEGN